MERSTAKVAVAAGCVLLIVACRGAHAPDLSHAARGPAGAVASATCPASAAAEPRPLVLPDGLQAYVEPVSLLRVGGSFVVVGTPTYTWDVEGDQARQVASRAHIAAYLDEGASRMIEKPLDVPIGWVRAVALDGHRWGVLFSEAERVDSTGAARGLVGIRYAQYDGARWGEVEEVPMPTDADVSLVIPSSSQLVAFEDGLSWAVTDLDGGTFRYERREGRWAFEVAERRGGEAAALASDDTGLWLAVSGLDPAISEPRKSIRLFRWRDGWQLVHRYPTKETYSEIHRPSLTTAAGGVTLTWVETPPAEDPVARAVVGISVYDSGRSIVVDAGAQRATAIGPADGSPAWVILHPPELRLVSLESGRVRTPRTLPYPYTGWFAAAAAGPREVLVTGPELDPDPAHATVRSLTLRLSLSCS